VSGYKPIQNNPSDITPANPASSIDTTAPSNSQDIFTVDKNSQTYKDLIASGKTDDWITNKYAEAKAKYDAIKKPVINNGIDVGIPTNND
jgi:hypothetical protein